MEHFVDETWTDFVRGASVTNAASDIASAFGRWLFTMRNDTSFLAQLYSCSPNKSGFYAPPAGLVQQVKLGFSQNLQRADRCRAMGALVFDSWESATPLACEARPWPRDKWFMKAKV